MAILAINCRAGRDRHRLAELMRYRQARHGTFQALGYPQMHRPQLRLSLLSRCYNAHWQAAVTNAHLVNTARDPPVYREHMDFPDRPSQPAANPQ